MKKVIPIGYEDYKEIIDQNLYFVDKTMMIPSLLDSGSKVSLFTRPRRFGKTLNLSMIRRFFEDERTGSGEKIDNSRLFKGLAVEQAGQQYLAEQQQYPVISMSLKSAKQQNFEMAYLMLKKEIRSEYSRHTYLLETGKLSQAERVTFERILALEDNDGLYYDGIRILSEFLMKYHQKEVIILIDEYDVPLENAYFRGFYGQMADFIRSLFESALKTNPCLKFGVITGCLRISRESIFTGLNNLSIQSLQGEGFCSDFGFTQAEVDQMLDYYGLEEKKSELRDWYDGYRIGDAEIYNPWSILNYIKKATVNPSALPQPYWANTSSNDIIRELIDGADSVTRVEVEGLLNGETVEKPVHEDITYEDIHQSTDNLWNFLFFTGYLKNCGERMKGNQIYMTMGIPNREIASIFERTILSWFDHLMKETDKTELYHAVTTGDAVHLGDLINDHLQKTISFFDFAENYYHGFLTGLLLGIPNYLVLSNRESGNGRPDIIMKEQRFRGKAIILELKVAHRIDDMENQCKAALRQIETQNYAAELAAEGFSEIIKYGIAFFKKGCMVMRGGEI